LLLEAEVEAREFLRSDIASQLAHATGCTRDQPTLVIRESEKTVTVLHEAGGP
jgi:hypothetical protein